MKLLGTARNVEELYKWALRDRSGRQPLCQERLALSVVSFNRCAPIDVFHLAANQVNVRQRCQCPAQTSARAIIGKECKGEGKVRALMKRINSCSVLLRRTRHTSRDR